MKKFLSVVMCLALMLAAVCVIPAVAEPTVTSVMQVANCNSYVSLRISPDTKSARLQKVYLGEYVTDCQAAPYGFIQCRYNGYTGYILSQYLKPVTQPWDGSALPNQQVYNCDSFVSLRQYADTNAVRLAQVPYGAVVTGCISYGDWVKCTYNGKTGYILAKYLKNGSDAPAIDLVGEAVVVNCVSYVSLRQSPSTSAKRLVQVPLGHYVIAKGNAGNGFVKVEYKGQTGYILSSYLVKSHTGNVELPTQKVVNCTSWVSLRATASTSSARLMMVPLGAKVTNCVRNGSFVKCTYQGVTGYILAAYLKNA